ncbi:lactoylglutathione lyase family protein glyoxalase I family protein [Seminavis robusta]|uniref:Lactoylglutathione lyase family protein glyoxalase I family protein n=1 Tax=Seminavis robusta TaxID=568900 RepID=A0A9N8EMK0_9STRA|nr:lactoylglutathione lyase family protein glyoxalase I family protein [Seminavis robusta]|eukprot:Sro1468_g275240.1 lactoylglutathione lyase family protein glyoxalase I family protein (134) ;mRNA; r:22582-22983
MTVAGVRLGRIVMMVRGGEGIQKAVDFYHGAMGLTVLRMTEEMAELRCGTGNSSSEDSISINFQAVHSEAQLSTGYSPLLSFEVADMNSVVAKCVQLGAHIDGPIQYQAHGTVAALRDPCGHMIGLYQPTATS